MESRENNIISESIKKIKSRKYRTVRRLITTLNNAHVPKIRRLLWVVEVKRWKPGTGREILPRSDGIRRRCKVEKIREFLTGKRMNHFYKWNCHVEGMVDNEVKIANEKLLSPSYSFRTGVLTDRKFFKG